jgi:hypothetical protein
MTKKFVLGAVLALAIMLIAAPIAMAAYGPAIVPDNGPVGTTATVSGQGQPGETFNFTFCTKLIPIGSATADQTGFYTLTFAVPTDANTGECHVRSVGSLGTVVDVAFTVAATPALAYTGAQIVFWVIGGLGIAAIGAGLMLNRRKVTA